MAYCVHTQRDRRGTAVLGVPSRRKRTPIKPNFNLCHQPPRITELSATVGRHPPPHATDPPNAFLPVLTVVYEPVGGGTGGWRVVWVAHAAATSGVPDGVNQFELDATAAARDCPQPSSPWIPCQQSASDCSMTCEWLAVQWEGDLRVKRVACSGCAAAGASCERAGPRPPAPHRPTLECRPA